MAKRVTPQAILTPLTESAIFLVVTVEATSAGDECVRALLPEVAGLTRSVGFRSPESGLSGVVGIGAGLWGRLFGTPVPAGLHPFREIAGAEHIAVSTPGDLLFHLRAPRLDLCFELAGLLMGRLGSYAHVSDEVHGFRYFDQRDLLGFVDGTENPTGAAAAAAVTIGGEDPVFAGGSYVIVQKYLHDLEAWNALAVEAQERVMGRTKLSDIELADDVKPSNSHVALNTIVDANGEQRQILRDNMPFGTFASGEFGTYFIGYASHPDVIEHMLKNMFIGDPPGNTDRVLDFSTAVTGSLFFVPSADFLDDPSGFDDPSGPDDREPAAGPDSPSGPISSSLGIGGLRPTGPG